MPSSPARRVAVVGGGVAGLTLAAALGRDHDVVVHEAQPERAAAGTSLVLRPAVLRALDTVGALDGVRDALTPLGPAALRDLAGRPLSPALRTGLVAVPRPDLLRALEAAVPARVVHRTGAVVDPAELDADLVVGADGVRSRVRGLVAPRAAERLATQVVALRGWLPNPPAGHDVGEYWGAGVLVGVVPCGGRTAWFTAHRSTLGPEPLDVASVLDEVRGLADDAGHAVHRVLDEADDDPTSTWATRIWVAPPMHRYVRGRYVVVGDAAHAMAPNLGRGAGDAVLDAVSLARALRSGRGPLAWQAERLPVTQAARVASAALLRVALLDRGRGPRDALLGLSRGGAARRAGTR